MFDLMALVILIASGLVVLSIFTSLLSYRVGAPLLLVFLGMGLLAGEDGIGGIDFQNVELAYFIGSLALAVILFDSGFETRLRTIRLAAAPAVALSTFGVLLTAGLVAIPAHFLLQLDWLAAFLFGAIISSTDAAAVFFLLRVGGLQIRERVQAALEIESGSNDPMAVLLTISLIELIAAGTGDLGPAIAGIAASFVLQMGLGIAFGAAGGWLVVQALNRIRLEPGLYPVIILGLALVLFSATSLAGGSGFLAVYLAGLVMGNMRLKGSVGIRRFQDGLTWLAQIVMFLMLGLLATPSQFPAIAWQAAALGLTLIFVLRPLAVWLCLLPFSFRRKETAFIGWVGLRGAVSILLAIFPIVAGIDGAQTLFNAAFIIVIISLVVQGWTIGPVARQLDLVVPPRIGMVDKVELELPGNARHEMVVYRVAPDSPVVGGERIPRWARPSLLVRNGRSLRLHEAGRPRPGDYIYIFVLPEMMPLLDQLFASPAEISDKDPTFFGDLTIDADKPIRDLAQAYAFEIGEDEQDLSIGDFLVKRLGPPLGRGDRLLLSPIELIVRDVDGDSGNLALGLSLEPTAQAARELPLFQNWREIVSSLRRLSGKKRRTGTPEADEEFPQS